VTLDELRRQAVARTLFAPTTLPRALARLGFVQADPIRAPARAQDLMLRHRVTGYRAGDLERRYAPLGVEEDFFVNYGFVTQPLQALMHPRVGATAPAQGPRNWPASRRRRAELLLAFVRERGEAHPREVDAHFDHGKVKNYWGGTSNATTHLLDAMHYVGMLRVARRDGGIRVYAPHEHGAAPESAGERRARLDAMVDVVLALYAPLPRASLQYWVRRLRYAAPQWQGELTVAIGRARERLAHERIDGVDWYWLAADATRAARGAERGAGERRDEVRLLAPFDPVVQDRTRFELLWGWTYRFEAYTPVAKRKLGYYALPLLWRDRVIGWANVARREGGALDVALGYVGPGSRPPRDPVFRRELDAEIERMRTFLGP